MASTLAEAEARKAHARRHRRAWAFEVAVALLTVAAGVLTLLALVVPYFAIDLAQRRPRRLPLRRPVAGAHGAPVPLGYHRRQLHRLDAYGQ